MVVLSIITLILLVWWIFEQYRLLRIHDIFMNDIMEKIDKIHSDLNDLEGDIKNVKTDNISRNASD